MTHKPIFNTNADSSATTYGRALFRFMAILISVAILMNTQALASVINGSTNEYEVAYSLHTNGEYTGATLGKQETLTRFANKVINIYESLTPYVTDITANKSHNKVDFSISATSYDSYSKKEEITAIINNIVANIDRKLPDKEKLNTIHNIVTANKIYSESTDLSSWSSYGVLKNNVGTCMGFTNTAYHIIDTAGIPVIKVLGNKGNEQHSWVEVYIDGSWLVYDPTYYVVTKENIEDNNSILWASDKISQLGYTWSQEIVDNIKDIRYNHLENYKSIYLTGKGLVVGTGTGINLGNILTRNELATIVARIHSKITGQVIETAIKFTAPFKDTNEWAEPYIQYCYDNLLLNGVGDGKFDGDREVTKRELALAFLRLTGAEASILNSVSQAIGAGLLSQSRDISISGTIAIRRDMVDIAYNTLQILSINT